MTTLDEALALLHPLRGLAGDEHEERALKVVEAAARNWHTLNNPTDELIEAVGRYLAPGNWWVEPELWKASITMYREQAASLIEFVALTVTAEEPPG